MDFDWSDPETRIVVIGIFVIIILALAFGGFIFGGGQEGWRNNFSYTWSADKENDVTRIYIYNISDENGLIKDKILTVESIVVKADGNKVEIPVVDAPPLEPYSELNPNVVESVVVTLDYYCEKLKVTKINYSYVLYEDTSALANASKRVECLLNRPLAV